jgi:hypothetical protein
MDLNSCVQILFALVVAILGTPASSSAQGTSTIHVAHPERRDETTITRGLVIRTYPMPAGQGIAKEPQQPSVTIDVKGPLVVGFFSPFTKAEEEADDGGIREGLAHLRFAIEDISKCYEDETAVFRIEITRSVILRDGRRTRRINIPRDWNGAVGLIFALPGRRHRIVFARGGPSTLATVGPPAAAAYFGAPACK